MRKQPIVHPKYWLVAADLLSDLGNQFVHMILLNALIFRAENGLAGLAIMSLIEQSPSIFLSRFAGGRLGGPEGKKWLVGAILAKWLLVSALLLGACAWIVFPAYLSFIACSVFFQVGRLFLPPTLVPPRELVAYNALNERISLVGRIFGPMAIAAVVSGACQKTAAAAGGMLFLLSALAITGVPCPGTSARNDCDGISGPAPPEPGDQPPPEPAKVRNPLRAARRDRGGPLRGDGKEWGNPLRGDGKLAECFRLFGLALLAGGILNIGLPILFKTRFESGIAAWGVILSGSQLGACLATVALPLLAPRFGRRAITSPTFVALGAIMALMARESSSLVRMTLLMLIFSFGLTLLHVYMETLIQQNSPRIHLAKTVSFLMAYKSACYLGTILGGAAIIGLWGTGPLLAAGALTLISAPLLIKT
jgi:hypothetical protein